MDTPATLLIVDDNAENLAVLGGLLEPLYEVRTALSGERALALALQPPVPDLVLLDVRMPGMDGFEVLRRLRAQPATRHVPVVLVTALTDPADEAQGLAEGAADYITKPVRPAVVLARVRTQLELKRARELLQAHNLALQDEVERRMGDNLVIQQVTIHALARLAETRDPETGNHLRRTQEYVRALARRLAPHPRFEAVFTEPTIALLARSAPLHDIGKVGIPDHVLLKPGKLDAQEWALMKTHARLGADAIAQAEADAERVVPFLAFAKEIAHWHHEMWDGHGYPDGLAGEAIPVSARLMAVADVFDALISRRVYKPPLPFERGREIMTHGRGRHFDPDMIDAFLAGFDEFVAIAQRWSDSEAAVQAKADSVAGRAPL